ncbi:MAG TPA: NAD(P)/FAD-dependent oxidoreductase [Polyangia bacterium]|nr:NAD(P)/FAD-dependent oxidoreductase [Polyangia bacterium]
MAELPHVVIIGGGFGGLYAARALRKAKARITLIDRRNHHLFQPLLYQVATAALNPSDIAAPIRSVLRRQKNATVLLAEAQRVDPAAKKVLLDGGDQLSYDWLIVAAGATHSYFGHDEWEPFAPGLKTIEDALEIRRRVLFAFEAAERERDAASRKAWMTFVVVGAGPTGVELAGALAEVSRHTLARDFRHIDPAEARIVLLEGGPRVLPTYPPDLSQKAEAQLRKLGVEVQVGAKVTLIDEAGVQLGDGARLDARTRIWGAGVTASPLGRSLGAPLDRAGRVKVTPRLTVPGHEEIFVIGDLAAVECGGKPVPGVAPAAMQGGAYAGRAVARLLVDASKPLEPFRYWDKGSLATIGRSAAVADFGRVKLSGFIAWAAWLLVHILYLIGFRNRILVLVEWAWAYVTFQRGARLITGAEQARLAERRDRDKPAA